MTPHPGADCQVITRSVQTTKHIEQFLSSEKLDILDVGGGPGRYSFHLAGLGNNVTLFDLSSGNIEFARRHSQSLGVGLAEYVEGNAVDLGRFSDDCFDLVLNLGPLYHINSQDQRRNCVHESMRVLKKSGVAFFAFISRYAPIYDTLKKLPEKEQMSIESLASLFETQELIIDDESPGFTDARLVDPLEVGSWIESLGYGVVKVFGAESLLPQSQYHLERLGKEKLVEWISFGYSMSETVGGIVGSEHVVVVARK